MKHTKGNWTAKGLHIMAERKTMPIGQSFAMDIPTYPKEGHVDIEAEANAKLMAAAPDLLKALKHLIANCEEISPGMPNILEAKEAIKKATGE